MNKLKSLELNIESLQSLIASETNQEKKSALILDLQKLEAERDEVIKTLSTPRNRMVSAK